jgi:hypothetical protein
MTRRESSYSSGRVTGSRAGAILGIAPWGSRKEVMREMVRKFHGAEPEFKGNAATQWGQWKEAEARLAFMKETGTIVEEPGELVAYKDWLGAICDGLVYADGETEFHGILETKTPFKFRREVSPEFLSLNLQPHYYAQLQVEMFCYAASLPEGHAFRKAPKAYFQQYRAPFDEHEGAMQIEVIGMDRDWIKENMPKLLEFWREFQKELDNPVHLKPKLEAAQESDPDIEGTALAIIREIDDIDDVLRQLEAKKKLNLSRLEELARGESRVWGNRKFTKTERKGSISYTNFFKDHPTDVDLEAYRGKSSEYWRLS